MLIAYTEDAAPQARALSRMGFTCLPAAQAVGYEAFLYGATVYSGIFLRLPAQPAARGALLLPCHGKSPEQLALILRRRSYSPLF